MKKILLFTLIFAFVSFKAVAQEVNWVSLDEAIALQKKEPRKILMDVYTTWCGPCKMLDKNTFKNSDVANYINANYYAVKFNAEGDGVIKFKGQTFSNPKFDPKLANRRNSPHELAYFLKIQSYPTLIFFDEQAEVIAPITGYKAPEQLELYLKMFYSNDYKTITTQDEFSAYYKAFTPEFKS